MPTEQNEPSDEMIKPSDANCVRQNFSLECRRSVCDEEREERKEKEKKRKQEERARTRVEITFFFSGRLGTTATPRFPSRQDFAKKKNTLFCWCTQVACSSSRLQVQQLTVLLSLFCPPAYAADPAVLWGPVLRIR